MQQQFFQMVGEPKKFSDDILDFIFVERVKNFPKGPKKKCEWPMDTPKFSFWQSMMCF